LERNALINTLGGCERGRHKTILLQIRSSGIHSPAGSPTTCCVSSDAEYGPPANSRKSLRNPREFIRRFCINCWRRTTNAPLKSSHDRSYLLAHDKHITILGAASVHPGATIIACCSTLRLSEPWRPVPTPMASRIAIKKSGSALIAPPRAVLHPISDSRSFVGFLRSQRVVPCGRSFSAYMLSHHRRYCVRGLQDVGSVHMVLPDGGYKHLNHLDRIEPVCWSVVHRESIGFLVIPG
jgi:hypothetical protein